MNHDFFLSAENPVANVDQRDMEDLALRLIERPELQKARAMVAMLFRNAIAWPAREQMDEFEAMIDELVFNFALRSVASDPHHPRILRLMQPPHHWFGRDVPGSRWGGDGTSFTYRMMAIAHGARYVLRGQATCDDPATVTYTLMENMPSLATVGIIDSFNIPTDENGGFEITIDTMPAEGRPNHFQTRAGEFHLLVRDAIGDWLEQTPNALRIERLDPADYPPLSEDVLAQRAAKNLVDSVYFVFYCTQSGSGQAPNQLRAPMSSGAFGGMATQWGTKSNIDLADDEAMIVTVNAAGALYRDATLCDIFFRSLDYWTRTGSFNMTQMAADADGKYSYVIAHRDPGVHNWLDTGGRQHTLFGCRWQSFPEGGATETPTIAARVVKFADLEKELPAGIAPIDAAGRREQLARREAGFKRRFIDS